MRVDDATQREAVGSWTGDHGGVGGWRAERQAAEGSLRLETTEELVAGEQREGSGDLTRERRTERLAWKNGGAVNTRH